MYFRTNSYHMKYIFTLCLIICQYTIYAQCESVEIDKTNWTIHSFDTEETNGEGANNGHAIHCIDDNINTFWHTQWQNVTSEYPHFIAIDMGANYPVDGIILTSRNDTPNNKPKAYELFLSPDGENWEPMQAAGDLTYPDLGANGQTGEFSFGAIDARYFKIIFYSNYSNDPHIAISELKATQISGEGCDATGQNNQILTFDEIPQHYATDAPFELSASSSSNTPIQFEIVEGPATVTGSTLNLTGEGGTVTVRAFQAENADYYMAEKFRSFEVVDLTAVLPEIHSRLTENYPLEMPELYAYKLTASASIAEYDVLDVENIEFYVDNQLLESQEGSHSYYAWWTPEGYGEHQVTVVAYASNGNQTTETYTINVSNSIENRDVTTLQNAVIDWGSTGSQWFYGTYEMPQSVGAYDQIMAEFNVTCPNVAGGCDDWDRLGYLQIKNADGQWIELIRYITPYGVACNHEIDLTDYASELQGKVDFRMYIETWGTGGWEMELILHYQQGTPAFLYSEVEEVWQGTYNFGDYANLQPIPQAQIQAPENTEEATFRVVTSGHGWGNNNTANAAEFYYAIHHFNVNEAQIFEQNLRVDCNPNPDDCTGQQGTWYYDRAGWCPGAIARPYEYNITPYIDSPYTFDYEFQPSYVDYCHPNHPDCVTGQTCSNCNDGYNPHYRIGAYNIYKGNNPLGNLSTQDIDNQLENSLIVMPNPSYGYFRVSLAEEMKNAMLQIYAVDGTSLKKYHFQNRADLINYTFHVEDLPSGIYFVRIYNEKQMASAKLIVK